MQPSTETFKQAGSSGRPSNITYERVDLVIRQILTEKSSFSCADVLVRIGEGSMATVHRFVKEWRAQNPSLQEKSVDLSAKLLASLRSELSRHVAEAINDYQVELQSARLDNDMLCQASEILQSQVLDGEQRLRESSVFLIEKQAAIDTTRAERTALEEKLIQSGAEIHRLSEQLIRAESRLAALDALEQQLLAATQARNELTLENVRLMSAIAALSATRDQLVERLNELRGIPNAFAGDLKDPATQKYARPHASARKQAGITKTKFIISTVEKMLEEKDIVSTPDILKHMKEIGFDIGGQDPMTNLAAILSKCKKFINSKNPRGWKISADKTNATCMSKAASASQGRQV